MKLRQARKQSGGKAALTVNNDAIFEMRFNSRHQCVLFQDASLAQQIIHSVTVRNTSNILKMQREKSFDVRQKH